MCKRTAVVLSLFALLCVNGVMADMNDPAVTNAAPETNMAAAETAAPSVSFSNYILVLEVSADSFTGGYLQKSILESAKGDILMGQYKAALKDSNSKDMWTVGDVVARQFKDKYIVTNMKLENITYNPELSNNLVSDPEIAKFAASDYRMIFINYQTFSGVQLNQQSSGSVSNPPVRMSVYKQCLVINRGKNKAFTYNIELSDSTDTYKVKDKQRLEARYKVGKTIFVKDKALMKQIHAYLKAEK